MSNHAPPSLLIELCSLCPVEPACERRQMLDHVNCTHSDAPDQAAPFAVKGQPYRCWLLALGDKTAPGD